MKKSIVISGLFLIIIILAGLLMIIPNALGEEFSSRLESEVIFPTLLRRLSRSPIVDAPVVMEKKNSQVLPPLWPTFYRGRTLHEKVY